jgi:hypothetical protein
MRSLLITVLLLATVVLPAHADEDACDMLFVQDAKAMIFDGNRLTLKDANPNIIFFCDRPVRIAGHMTRDAFMKLVSEGEDSFAKNPPNAAISIFSASSNITEVVAVLPKRPVVSGDDLIFTIKVLEGKLPAEGDGVVMFIDTIGRPVSPTSAAGVHRRHERRSDRRD